MATIRAQQDSFSAEQLASLRKAYGSIERANVGRLADFRRVFVEQCDERVRQLAVSRIRFVSKLAVNELVRRGVV